MTEFFIMAVNCYKKIFICETRQARNGENSNTDVTKTIMKASVLGVITGIQKFSRRTIYSVDDGTGSLDCVLWHNESSTTETFSKIIKNMKAENVAVNDDVDAVCQLLLNKIQINQEEPDYDHGNIICCMGIIKLVKGKLLLDVYHHYKADNVNAETLWILNVLSCHQNK